MPQSSSAPEGLLYNPDFLTESEEAELLHYFRKLEYREIRMHGVIAKRRVQHFGLLYGYESWRLDPGPPLPEWLQSLHAKSAGLAGVPPEALAEALVTEYPAGAGIGYHRDAPMFGTVVGVSLGSECRMRFRRGSTGAWETFDVDLHPRSAYVLTGPARTQWQHGISATKALRYSVTFRTLCDRQSRHPRQKVPTGE